MQTAARADPELAEHLPQVQFDRPGTEEQLPADLRVRQPVARELRDLLLLRREIVASLEPALSDGLARGGQLAPGAQCERLHPHVGEQLVRRAELLTRVHSPTLAAQPFAVQQVRPGALPAETRAPEAVDGIAIEGLGTAVVADKGA